MKQTSSPLPVITVVLLVLSVLLAGCNPSSSAPEGSNNPDGDIEQTPSATFLPNPTSASSPTPFSCQEFQASIVLLVEESYLEPLATSLDQFAQDLCQDQYQLIITPAAFDSPEEVRSYLQQLYFEHSGETLAGAILIGDIPYPYLQIRIDFITEDIPPRYQEMISMWYYMDLDGEFALSENYQPVNGEAPLGEPIFDIHPEEIDLEIWVSVLPPYLGDPEETISALERYFEKNHAYRMGEIDLPRTVVYVTSIEVANEQEHEEFMGHLLGGNLNWTALKGELEPLFFFNSETAGLTTEQGYQAISEGVADFSVVIGHGTVGSVMHINNPWLEENELNTIFFWSHSCDVADLDNQYHILSQILYHPTSLVLFTTGNSTEAGGLGINENGPYPVNIATALSQGSTLGEAILSHFNIPQASHNARNPELSIGPKIFYGDLTLRVKDH